MPIVEGPGSKDDPLHTATRAGNKTIWLDRATSDEARDKYFKAYAELEPAAAVMSDKRTWDIAWAAAVAAHDYVWSGRIGPD